MAKHSFYLIVLAFITIVIFVASPLYGQAPTPLKTTNTEKNPSQNIKKETKRPQDSAKNLTVSPQIYPPTTPLPQETAKKHDDKATPDWWLVGFTGALVGVGILQFLALRRQAHWMYEQSEDIKQSIIVAKETAEAVRTQAETMRQELILAQRPKLRIRNVITKNFPDLFEIGKPISGQLYIVNVGGMPAKITNIGCWVKCLRGGLPMERPYEGENPNYPNPISTKLLVGQSFPLNFTGDVMGETYNLFLKGSPFYMLYVMGYVEYVDDIGTFRRTVFCREYRLQKLISGQLGGVKRFFPVDDPDYEAEE